MLPVLSWPWWLFPLKQQHEVSNILLFCTSVHWFVSNEDKWLVSFFLFLRVPMLWCSFSSIPTHHVKPSEEINILSRTSVPYAPHMGGKSTSKADLLWLSLALVLCSLGEGGYTKISQLTCPRISWKQPQFLNYWVIQVCFAFFFWQINR